MDEIEMILEWADNHPRFDTSFVLALKYQDFDLTDNQQYALANIIEKWNIQRWFDRRRNVQRLRLIHGGIRD